MWSMKSWSKTAKALTTTLFLFCGILMSSPRGEAAQHPGPEQDGCRNPLILAVQAHDSGTARNIIQTREGINDTSCGVTALTEAIAKGEPTLARQLVIAGADTNQADIRHVSPLMYAAFYCQYETASLLIEHQARVNDLNDDGESALMLASANCSDGNIASLLIRAGADVNVLSKTHDSALALAVASGDEFAVKALVAAGANLEAANFEGQTALAIARDLRLGRKPVHDRIYAFLLGVAQL